MKKIFYLATILMAITFNAQESDTQKLGKLLDVLKEKQDNKTVDSVAIELDKLKNTEDKAVQIMLPEAKALISDIRAENSNKVESKPISVLSKDDLKNLKISDDKFENISFVEFKNAFGTRPYISIKNGFLGLRLVLKYQGKDWVFFDKVILMNNGKKFEIEKLTPERDVFVGYVTERVDIRMSKELYNYLNEAINSGLQIDIRFDGKRVDDDKFSKSDLIIFKKIFSTYEKLKK